MRYNSDVHQPILIVFGRNVAAKASYKTTETNADALHHSITEFCILSEPPLRQRLGRLYEAEGDNQKMFSSALRRKMGYLTLKLLQTPLPLVSRVSGNSAGSIDSPSCDVA